MEDSLPGFDAPFFKRLAPNDTGNAPGHQSGIVIPKDLDSFFPTLPATSVANPTVGQRIKAILVVPGVGSQTVDARYQHQTWGAQRPPERRLTDNLSFLRNEAHGDDIVVFERSLHELDTFRLTLLKAGTPEHTALSRKVGAKRWGVVDVAISPVKDSAIITAEQDQDAHEAAPLALFDNAAGIIETRVQKIARSAAFQKRVTQIYDRRCAICGEGLLHPQKGFEVEAAHIVPRGRKGADDARNGLALCRLHHWAFDHGLFGVQPKDIIYVPSSVKALKENKRIADLEGMVVRPPNDKLLRPAAEAFEWHLKNIVDA
jgi:putative restriction endonuclease